MTIDSSLVDEDLLATNHHLAQLPRPIVLPGESA